MNSSMKSSHTARIAFFSIGLLMPCAVFGALEATIQIDQVSPGEYGTWSLLTPDGEIRANKGDPGKPSSESFTVDQFGQVTLSTTLPAGMTAKILIERNGTPRETVDLPQVTVELSPGDNYRFIIQYASTRLGTLGIISEPSRARFQLRGPTQRRLSGRTPRTFTNIPSGRYTITFRPLRGCVSPAPKTVMVEPEKRIVLNVTIPCNVTEDDGIDRTRPTKRSIVEAAKARELKPRGERK